jgi:thiamine-phosphate pyrophosphorylase
MIPGVRDWVKILPIQIQSCYNLNKMERIDWRLCLIADTEFASGKDIIRSTEEAVEEGITLVQLRAKNLSSRDFFHLALELAKNLKRKKIPLIVNDRADIAFSCGAAGCHLGQEDLPLPYARKMLGKDKLIGISVHTEEEALLAEEAGADYLGVGPIYSTSTKKSLIPPLGLETLKALRERIRIPILAIGGINAQNAFDVMACGADGIAVISAIWGAENLRQATRELWAAVSGRKS